MAVQILPGAGFSIIATLALSGAVLGGTASGAIVATVSLSGDVIGVSLWVLSGTITLPGVAVLVLSGTPFLSKVISGVSPIERYSFMQRLIPIGTYLVPWCVSVVLVPVIDHR